MTSRFDEAVDRLERAAVLLRCHIDETDEAQHAPGPVRDALLANLRQITATRDALLALAPSVPGATVADAAGPAGPRSFSDERRLVAEVLR